MTTAALLVLVLARPAPAPSWEKVYERPEKKQGMLAVWADERGWFASGPGLLVNADPNGAHPQPVGERTVVGFSGANRAELFAVGWDELVFRLDGDKWVEEHRALGPPQGGKGKKERDADDLLQSVVPLSGKAAPMVTAIGPKLVLVRHPDGFWQALPDAERQALFTLAHSGRADALPAGCALASWSWVAKDRAMFSCHDGRSFVFEAGKTTPAGKLPPACKQGLDHARLHGTEAHTLCAGQLWQSDGTRWRQVRGPGKLRDYAFTERCLYAVTDRAVWRRCSP